MHEYMNQLVDGLKSEGIECSPAQAELLLKHLDLVIAKNKELNLTRIDSIEDGIYLHVIDSLLCARKLSVVHGIESVLDLGTGGGFPGIPLAIMLDTKVTLLDSIQKKISAVDGFIHALGLDDRCAAKCSRSEDLARTASESFDLVVSRAVAQLNVLIEYASPLLATGGMLCALKANLSDD
ncbi:MAG: 16S rRNA (guanine(527)-N(7))-methyltransferase RsmG, partial [Coriobacteriales bacterium]|nr:16S rRNA (guanine(527)-N(7))-methyltransferase RsmG [Coriobacteriales bacterium]